MRGKVGQYYGGMVQTSGCYFEPEKAEKKKPKLRPRNNSHNEVNEDQILIKVRITGSIGRHKYKPRNQNILKKLRRMVREGKLIIKSNTRDFISFTLPEQK